MAKCKILINTKSLIARISIGIYTSFCGWFNEHCKRLVVHNLYDKINTHTHSKYTIYEYFIGYFERDQI